MRQPWRHTQFALALLAAATLAACGGDSPGAGDQSLKAGYTQQVTFGDSLVDVGSYAVGTVRQLGGGKYTINGDSSARDPALTGKIWVELMAAQFSLPAPCAAQTGLAGNAAQGFAVPVQNFATCYNYGQGGARVSNPVGPGNAATGVALGSLTVPVATQVATHLARTGGKFSGTEIVFVMAGGNDVFSLLTGLRLGATAAAERAGAAEGLRVAGQTFVTTLAGLLGAGANDPAAATQRIAGAMAQEAARPGSTSQTIVGAGVMVAAAQPGNAAVGAPGVYLPLAAQAETAASTAGNAAGLAAGQQAGADYAAANGPQLVTQMATAGAELATIVNTQIVAKGATRVVVNNLPDVGNAPAARAEEAQIRQLVFAMVDAFNNALKNGLGESEKTLYVDVFAVSRDQVANPAQYGLSNSSTPACGPNPLGDTALACTAGNLVGADVSRYMFADDVHPTPYTHSLIAQYVSTQLVRRGWM